LRSQGCWRRVAGGGRIRIDIENRDDFENWFIINVAT
jgi:hypothetical protein